MIRSRLFITVIILGCFLAGCSSGNDPLPRVEFTKASTSDDPPEWTAEEQEYIDAIHAYLKLKMELFHDPGQSNPSRIQDVADPPLATEDFKELMNLIDRKQYYTGEIVFTALDVSRPIRDKDKDRSDISGCSDYGNFITHTADGVRIDYHPSMETRIPTIYTVTRSTSGAYRVVDSADGYAKCSEVDHGGS
jgi:hypothetical protein